MISNFKSLLSKVKKEKLNLYSYKILEVLCHTITLSSIKILEIIKEVELFPILIEMVFLN